jgi:hypothetical protein
MKTLADVKFDPNSFFMSLNKLLDKRVVDIRCGISKEWGEPVVTCYSILFDDGTSVSLQGEHDIIYIDDTTCSEEQLDLLYEEENGPV